MYQVYKIESKYLRVGVGKFKTLREAKKFISQYTKPELFEIRK